MLTASGANTYQWSPKEGLSATIGQTVTASPDVSTIYYATGSVGSCTNIGSATITVIPAPDITMIIQPTVAIISSPVISFNFSSAGISPLTYWQWTIGTGDTTITSQSFNYTYSAVGKYLICLIAINKNGCKDSLSEYVIINPENSIYIPSAFNPHGTNRVFYIYGEGLSDFKMMIFTRWGEKIYESNDINQGWDGKLNNKLQPGGVYIYRISYKDAYNKQDIKYGEVTLLK